MTKKVKKIKESITQILETTPKKKEPVIKDYLTKEHILKLESFSKDIEIAKLTLLGSDQVLKNLRLELKLFETQIQKQESLVGEKSKAYENTKQKMQSFVKEISPEYGVTGQFGYDPDSGQIKR